MMDESEERGDTIDLEERTSYILAAFCSTCKRLDQKLRERDSLEKQPSFSNTYIDIDDYFPLCDALAVPAATYLASMLAIDENPALSESLYDKYCDSIAILGAECSCSAISDVYFND